jgi:hypothetical protein
VRLPGTLANAGDASPGETLAVSSQTISGVNPTQLALMRQMEPELLMKDSEPMFDTDIARNIAAAFRPEIIKVGHVQIYSSVVTAIARKNPFCLLSPAFLNISF